MRLIYIGIYFISALATIVTFILGNLLTEPLMTESGLGEEATAIRAFFLSWFYFHSSSSSFTEPIGFSASGLKM
ncbi:hypothetical protein FZC79_05570 [Rossellomorea vietnamensis]|uniref:Uncharacterized protein n=2 Tax=Rossellomorea TaxID=2837508 RepID=A0A5D4KGF5_9BACI|nr:MULTISPECIES: hypothetical protein [Rossellomorea]TYR76357.1 hypothetical protein FZC79_05570 [Rossellomorea vietnamensis]TYS76298.1 hypothetical protein FZC80_15280 [Rossellomorea aquimaris]